ncbi:hypothetical protein, partial [Kitasatospora sp. LaBMicrA B282]|uniref:hypothetical protein n=1 Tax=Kitasatospora sp. LaBMicrA B282 TaxID=3420949 RepID=UPI003D0A9807
PAGRGTRGRRRGSALRRLALLGLTAAVVSGAVAFAVVRYDHHGQPVVDPTTGPTQAPVTPTALPTSAPTTPSATTPPGPAPAGYSWVTDPMGFRFPEPLDGGVWQRSQNPDNNNVYYSPDGEKHLIQFASQVGQSLTPLDHLTSLDHDLSTKPQSGLANYHRESLAAATVHGYEAAQWVYTFTNTTKGQNAGPRRVIEEEYRDGQGTSYTMLVSGPANGTDRTQTENRFTALLNGFTPVAP